MVVHTVAVSSIIDEFALIYVTIQVVKGPWPIRLSVAPLTLVLGSVPPALLAEAVLDQLLVWSLFHLAGVCCTILKHEVLNRDQVIRMEDCRLGLDFILLGHTDLWRGLPMSHA